jgi:cytoskeletal protein RodZ
MMGLGTLLEKARLKQGLTIEEMSERTKIRPQYLQAIEGENYDLLPGEAYVKPFIRTYAKALGLEDEIGGDIEPLEPTSEEIAIETSIRERRERVRKARRRRFVIRLAIATVILVGSLYLVYRLMNV